MGLSTTFGVSVYSVAIDDISRHFKVSSEAANVPLTLYIIGQAIGPMIAAPLSERYGRKAVLLIPVFFSLLFTMGAGLAPNLAALCILRFLSGATGSPALSVGNVITTEVLAPAHRSVGIAVMNISPFLGTALGPILGGYAVQAMGWRWSQWLMIFIALPVWLAVLPMSETYKKAILARQQAKSKSENPVLTADVTWAQQLGKTFVITLGRPLKMLFTEPIVMAFAVYVAFNFSVLFSFLGAFPVVFQGVYGFNLGESGLAFLGIAVGVFVELPIYLYLDRITYQRKLSLLTKANGTTKIAPEARLYPALLGSVLIPVGLFMFGWLSRPSIHWIAPVIATSLFAIGNLLVFACCMLYLVDAYGPLYGASAVGANGLPRYIVGGVAPLYTTQLYARLGVHWASSLLGFIAVALAPVPWPRTLGGSVAAGATKDG
ncbi:hypothetical protein NQ176_g5332 [Zarea fungicola]|uniref:Uncharacterized protein n=1 Tax=Zarea fungicola TaxID=93591 RepID=A0ACC1NBD3_9HYPO|nr:hypothetical protein NQ176_g5332 [Lecanicillium fungicola]